jgi:hypothetical protein
MAPAVKSVEPKADFMLAVEFDSGESGTLDMKPYLDFGVFSQLKDKAMFRQVRVAFGTVEWTCGADLDPEFVYEKCRLTAMM